MGEIEGVRLTPLRMVHVPEGDVYHGVKAGDPGYVGFGEAYFSTIHPGSIKPWKLHRRMTLNLIVVRGLVRFVVHDDRQDSRTCGVMCEYRCGFPEGYSRLTIAPGLWMAFQGLGAETSLLLNVADIAHDPDEAIRGRLDDYPFDWSLQ